MQKNMIQAFLGSRGGIKQKSKSDTVFAVVNYFILCAAFLVVAYPLYFVLIASVSDVTSVNLGQVFMAPKGFHVEGYRRIFMDDSIITGYTNSIIYTALGTVINLLCTLTGAYALSRRDMPLRKVIMTMIIITMFFSGGMIPNFLLVKNLRLYNTVWAIVLPVAIVPWNLIVARTFYETNIPLELLEAAQMDGYSDIRFFISIALPLSTSITAIMALFYGVMHWNSYFSSLLYFTKPERYPLQLVLRNILVLSQMSDSMKEGSETASKQYEISGLIQYGVIVVSSLPLLIIYPFLQNYFVKGIMIGAIKG